MTFEDIAGNGKLWAVKYDGDDDNILSMTFDRWNDLDWLKSFFAVNAQDLSSYFKITNLNEAIYDTLSDAHELECVILDAIDNEELDLLFRPLENLRSSEVV
jgi:NDP-sugar pyrophosphorylase family protein